MLDLEQLIQQIERHGIRAVSDGTGLPYNTVKNVSVRRNPTVRVANEILAWLATQDD